MTEDFNSMLDSKSKVFNEWLNSEKFYRIYTHLDADGLSSASIMISFLKSKGKHYHLTVLDQLNEEYIKDISLKGSALIFMDFGSGQLERLKEIIKERKLLILDHHQPQGTLESVNLLHINPCNHGIDGGTQVSSSGVVYSFLKRIGLNNTMASIALIGATGDVQELTTGINSGILRESNLEERKDLNIYGLNIRPVHKALEYSSEGFIPGVSGSETGAVNFLNELKIPLKEGDAWRTIGDLTSKEKQDLISGVIVKRGGNAEVFKNVYEFKVGKKRSLEEWAGVLNACGRMGNPSLGINMLLNPETESEIDKVLKSYRSLIVNGLNWLETNMRNAEFVKETEKALYFNAKDKIDYRIIGTICSIKSDEVKKEFIIGLAENTEAVKVSVRKTGNNTSLKASDLVINAALGIGEGGGHAQAAGANIKKGSETVFIEAFEKALDKV